MRLGVNVNEERKAEPMTEAQALRWARKRYGRTATVGLRAAGDHCSPANTHRVGHVALGMFFEVRGTGPTWQAACDDANARDARVP